MRSTLPTFNEVWQQQFRKCILKQIEQFSSDCTFLVGCSGGMDSMLLLHLMAQICPEKLRIVHVDHQLQPQSAVWGDFVSVQASRLNIPCIVQKVQVASGNLENQAREARYQVYQQYLLPSDVLVLAHHQQDQAETVILRLLSGTGIHGLAAMQSIDKRAELCIWRPFLSLSREQIEEWARQIELEYVEDPTNTDVYYDRAWCREQLWPLLTQRFPKMQQAISRTSVLMQDAEEILQEVLQQDWQYCGDEQQLDLSRFNQISIARQRQLLSAWMKGQGHYRPAFDMVVRLQQEVIASKTDARAALHWNHYYYVRYRQQLFRLEHAVYLAERLNPLPVVDELQFSLLQHYDLASGEYKIQQHDLGLSASLLGQPLQLYRRQGGEKIHLYGRIGHWPLKKAIQEAHILPWLRHTIQILMLDNVMLGVFTPKGFWLAQSPYCESGGWQPSLISQSLKNTNGERSS